MENDESMGNDENYDDDEDEDMNDYKPTKRKLDFDKRMIIEEMCKDNSVEINHLFYMYMYVYM